MNKPAAAPRVLLINPWIYDFAAYDFWAKPMGLLYLGAILRQRRFTVGYIDCLERRPAPLQITRARQGRGPWLKTAVPKPPGLADVPRTYARYGMAPDKFASLLKNQPRPDLVLITCLMTYWYPGVQAVTPFLRRIFPGVPLLLGGIYASLCEAHARKTMDVDAVITGMAESRILELASQYTGYPATPPATRSGNPWRAGPPADAEALPYPAWDLQPNLNYLPVLTTRGCPLRCPYCASSYLTPQYTRRSPQAVLAEIIYWQARLGMQDLAFYDDALLLQAPVHAEPLFEGLIASGLKLSLHTPNALHISAITPRIARLMLQAGFKTLRLGLETANFQERRELDHKVTASEFQSAVSALKNAGFQPNQVGAYILVGLPGQNEAEILASFETVRASGITPIPAYYSPIPHTALWSQAVKSARYDLEADPIYTNNAVLPCRPEGFSWSLLTRLKQLTGTVLQP